MLAILQEYKYLSYLKCGPPFPLEIVMLMNPQQGKTVAGSMPEFPSAITQS